MVGEVVELGQRTMMSHVVFVDEWTSEQHEVQLVYPKLADAEHRRISVTTPIGAALIGMRQGDNIEWPNRADVSRRLQILAIVQPAPEA
jgi:regulator of nucleoside diphosphate kinase